MDNIKKYLTERINGFDDIEPVVREVLAGTLGEGWTVRFSNKRRVFGSCLDNRVVELSRPFCEAYLKADKSEVVGVILHELAHAMVLADGGYSNPADAKSHGKLWKERCKALGIPNEKARHNPKVRVNSLYSWFLVNHETGEVFGRFFMKPKKDYSRCWIPGRREETEGRLVVVSRIGVAGEVFS